MKRMHLLVIVLVVCAVLAGACSSQGTSDTGVATSAPVSSGPTDVPTASPTFTPMDTATPVAGPATINVGKSDPYGSILVDGKGMAIYAYANDTAGKTDCYGQCAFYWPPVLTTGAPVVGPGVDATKLGTLTRSDGTVQVTYNGLALYTYSSDANPGEATGQNYNNLWNLVAPTGDKVK